MSETSHQLAPGDTIELLGKRGRVSLVQTGRLGTDIYQVTLDTGNTAYLKAGAGEAAVDLDAEYDRLTWLKGRIPVPDVTYLDRGSSDDTRLLVDLIPGQPAHLSDAPRSAIVDVLAEALQQIHAIDPADCPFRDTLALELAEAERRVRLGKIDEPAFLAATGGTSPAQALAELDRRRGIIQATTFTHGDYCLPNVILRDGALSGIIDWGIAGVADPHRDFMAVRDSLEFNFGPEWVARFFDAVGLRNPDEERLAYYTLLDQFFAHYVP